MPDISLQPEIEAAFHVNLGVLQCDGGHLEDAIAEYEEAIRLHNKLAAALEQRGRSVEAENQRRRSQELDSKKPSRH